MKTKGIVVKDNVTSFIEQAIQSNAPIETLERLFNLQKDVQAEFARNQFNSALVSFQASCPEIKKTKKVMNKDGKTVRYMFAPLDSIISQIQKPLRDAEISYAWDTTNDLENKLMNVVCTITHVLGYSKQSSFSIPIVTGEFMTSPQSYASAQTFAKRYTLCNALGIATAEEDNDATTVKKEKDAMNPKSAIMFALRKLGYETTDAVVIKEAVMKITKLTLEEKNFDEIISRLNATILENESETQSN